MPAPGDIDEEARAAPAPGARGEGWPEGVAAATPDDSLDDLRLMLTAAEAYPYLEDLFLNARHRVAAGFRIFDPETRLISDAARAVGETWADLVAHTLRRGVPVTLVLSDFDPVGAPRLHAATHRSLRLFSEAATRAGARDLLDARAHLHPAGAGPVWRTLAAPMARQQLAATARRLGAQGAAQARAALADAPGLAAMLVPGPDGTWRPRRGLLPRLHPCTHHQKLAVADARHLYIGGLDLDERRRDGLSHDRAAERTWHDVALGLTGAVAAEAEAHLDAFPDEVTGRRAPAPRPGLLRTLSAQRRARGRLRFGPRPLASEIFERTLSEIGQARDLVYLETQFLRDTRFARALAARGRAVPGLRLLVVLPAAPDEVAFEDDRSLGQRFGEHMQAKCIRILERAFGARAAFVSPAQPRAGLPDGTRRVLHGAPIVYVHAKVSVIDDAAAIVSSANLNGRSHRWDTEAGIAIEAPAQVALLRERLMTHWLPEGAGPAHFAPATAPERWRTLAEANRRRAPQEREGFLLPYPRMAPRRFGRPVPFLRQEMV
jgi:phospholipase D1/2